MRSRSPSTRPVIVFVGDILAAWETIAKITTSSLHRNNNSQSDEYYERFLVIESIPMSRPFLPLTVLLVYFVDFQPIAIGPRARSILFETKILLESVTNVEPSLQMASSPVLPTVPCSSITSDIEVKLIFRLARRCESVVWES